MEFTWCMCAFTDPYWHVGKELGAKSIYVQWFSLFPAGKDDAKRKQEITLAKARENAFKQFVERPRRLAEKAISSINPENDARNMAPATVPSRSLGIPDSDSTPTGRGSVLAGMGGTGGGMGVSPNRRASTRKSSIVALLG